MGPERRMATVFQKIYTMHRSKQMKLVRGHTPLAYLYITYQETVCISTVTNMETGKQYRQHVFTPTWYMNNNNSNICVGEKFCNIKLGAMDYHQKSFHSSSPPSFSISIRHWWPPLCCLNVRRQEKWVYLHQALLISYVFRLYVPCIVA
jgi:hypothetical protein